MTNGKGSAYRAETRLRELVAKWRNKTPEYSAWDDAADELEADLDAPVEEALTAPPAEGWATMMYTMDELPSVQAEVESRSVQRRKALQRGEPMPTFEASVQADDVAELIEDGKKWRASKKKMCQRCFQTYAVTQGHACPEGLVKEAAPVQADPPPTEWATMMYTMDEVPAEAGAGEIPAIWRIDRCTEHKDYVADCPRCQEEVLSCKLEQAYRAGRAARPDENVDKRGPAPSETATRLTPDELAKRFHELYESLAPKFGYQTRKESAVDWEQVPEQNRELMIAVCEQVQKELQG